MNPIAIFLTLLGIAIWSWALLNCLAIMKNLLSVVISLAPFWVIYKLLSEMWNENPTMTISDLRNAVHGLDSIDTIFNTLFNKTLF
jgi:uncharacterized SAM-binding protein YcdF (DUF218 family)